ncbi:MAG: Brp/Blh family beta-carotene 15,15'-monooxygenase [Chitinophagales bacterium]|jgi:Brp/Blh family beta-carotene 15,15'-monooxygenase
MTKAAFLFISSVLILLPFILNAGEVDMRMQMLICLPLLLLLGIPHGAIDHVLYLRKNKDKNTQFVIVYLVIVGLNILLWLVLPSIAYIVFLLISAYHFGQSQFSHYLQNQAISHKAVYLFWGLALLSGFIYFNLAEIQGLTKNLDEFAAFAPIHQRTLILGIFLSTGVVTLLLLIYLVQQNILRLEQVFMEFFEMALILICFYLMPLLIGFTLYFIILHALKVLREEYEFLHAEKEVHSFLNFMKLLSPFTLVSIAGIAMLFALIYLNILKLSYGYLLLMVISSITLPHVFVMNSFYNLLSLKNHPK